MRRISEFSTLRLWKSMEEISQTHSKYEKRVSEGRKDWRFYFYVTLDRKLWNYILSKPSLFFISKQLRMKWVEKFFWYIFITKNKTFFFSKNAIQSILHAIFLWSLPLIEKITACVPNILDGRTHAQNLPSLITIVYKSILVIAS